MNNKQLQSYQDELINNIANCKIDDKKSAAIKPGSPSESIYQTSTDASTESSIETDNVSNDSTLNAVLVEKEEKGNYASKKRKKKEEKKVAHKKHKINQKKTSKKGKDQSFSQKPDIDNDKIVELGPSSADSHGNGPKVLPLKIVIPNTYTKTGTRTNGKNIKQTTAVTAPSLMTASIPTADPSEKLRTRCRKSTANHTESETTINTSSGDKTNESGDKMNESGDKTNESSDADQDTSNAPSPDTNHQFTNYHQLHLERRKQIDENRKNLLPVKLKPPNGYNTYSIKEHSYTLSGNIKGREAMKQIKPPPANLDEQLKRLFVKQEQDRLKLKLQHTVQKEKLVLIIEEEILRAHSRLARASANQKFPYSASTILMDEYKCANYVVEEKKEEEPPECEPEKINYNDQDLWSELRDLDDKWEKTKESMIQRHRFEAESLHVVQKMDWEWKLQELGLYISITEEHVPKVEVFDVPDEFPA